MAREGFGEATPIGAKAVPSVPEPVDVFTLPPPPPSAQPLPQPPAVYHPPPPGTVTLPSSPPMPPPSFRPGATADRNWMGIVSLVLGLLGGGLLGLGFGIAGLNAAKAGRATNRTMAIWGIVLNCTMWIVYWFGYVALIGISGAFGPTSYADSYVDRFPDPLASDLVPVTEIELGACFVEPEGDGEYFYGVEVISCDEPHFGQVYAAGNLAEQAYVSEQHMGQIAFDICFTDEAVSALDPAIAAELYADAYYPGSQLWASGDRGYRCFVWDERGPLTRSVYVASPLAEGVR